MDDRLIAFIILLAVIVQRLAELMLAKRNTAFLKETYNAYEVGAEHYPFMILLHTSWIMAVGYCVYATEEIVWPWIGVVVALQVGRFWVLSTLGRFWTTRVIIVPDMPMIRKGPYRFLNHPNYWVVAGEIASLPLAFGGWETALIFSVLNALMLFVRIRVESRANQLRT